MVIMNNNLRVFLAVAEKKSFTAAAQALYISQPAVSRAVKALEEELSLKLFHRDKRQGLLLTDAGENVLALAHRMADLENRMYQIAFRERHMQGGRVRIASMPILTSVILSKVFHDFRQKYPGVTLQLIEGSASEIVAAVSEHRADFGLTSAPFGHLDAEVLMHDEMVAVSREPLADTVLDFRTNTQQLIFCRAGYETVLAHLRPRGIALPDCFVVEQAQSVLHFVEQRNGMGVISSFVLAATPHTLHCYPVHPDIRIDFGLVAPDLQDLPPAASSLVNMVRKACQKEFRG